MRGIRVGVVIAILAVCNLVFAGDQLFFKAKTLDTKNPTLFGKDISYSSFKSLSEAQQKNIKYFIVQFQNVISEKEKNSIKTKGFEILRYIPEQAFIIRGEFSDVENLYSVAGVKWIGRYEPELRGETEILSWSLLNQDEKLKVIVNLFNTIDVDAIKERVINLSNNLLMQGENTLVVEINKGNISNLVSIEGVEWIEKFYPMQLTAMNLGPQSVKEATDLSGLESGVAFLGLNGFYEMGLRGSSEIVGIADTGLDNGVNDETIHPDVRGRIIDAFILGLWSDSWADSNGHGTHVTGSVLGNGAASNGLIMGGAPEARLVFQSLLTGFGGLYVPPDLKDLFHPSAEKGASLHSNSWGNPSTKGLYSSYSKSLDEYVFNHPDFLPVFAAGNEGIDENADGVIDEGSVIPPGTAKNALTIGASEGVVSSGGVQKKWGETRLKEFYSAEPISSDHLSDNENGVVAFSSRGPTLDGRIKPDVLAPGTNVLSLKSQHPDSDVLWGLFNDFYAFSGGTSMATPLATGSLLVLRQYLKEKLKMESISAALLKAIVINSAKDLYPGQFGDNPIKEIPVTRPNVHEGWGRINLDSILNKKVHFVDFRKGMNTGDNKKLFINVKSGTPLSVTLVYSDAPGALSASKVLVNDLDLSVISPGNVLSYPNHGTGADRINNVEGIDLINPKEGTYVVSVYANEIPKGPQPYALVISGDFELN